MSADRRLGVLGGTFDPIHRGHLEAGEAAQRALQLDEIRVIPSHDPPHRPLDPMASAYHRFALCALAIDGRPAWRLSDTEVTRTGPSYTAHTLRTLHADGWRPSQIFFILGTDAFAEIATWYEFPAVLDLANFVVVSRQGTTLDAAIARTDALQPRMRVVTAGERVPPDSSNTSIFLLAATIADVSSTDIRKRLAAGLPIDELVPARVARYIHSQHLYDSGAPVGGLHGKTERTHG